VEVQYLTALQPTAAVAADSGQMVHQLGILAQWDQAAAKQVIIAVQYMPQLLDKDIQAAKADITAPLLLWNIAVQVVVVVQANRAVLAYTMIQIEDLKAQIVKVVTMNGAVLTMYLDGQQAQQFGATAATD
jgi:hypothetical protein